MKTKAQIEEKRKKRTKTRLRIFKRIHGMTYTMAHSRVRKARGTPSLCEKCGTTTAKRFEWANKTGKYTDPNDFMRMCTSCHKIFDNQGIPSFYDRNKKLKLPAVKCPLCGRMFKRTSMCQIFCGSNRKKTGCSYIRYVRYNKNYWNKKYKALLDEQITALK